MSSVGYEIKSTLVKLRIVLDLGGVATNLRLESLLRLKNVCRNISTVITKARGITNFETMCQLLLLIKVMALIPLKGKLFKCICLKISTLLT